jgi:hypothetical protein
VLASTAGAMVASEIAMVDPGTLAAQRLRRPSTIGQVAGYGNNAAGGSTFSDDPRGWSTSARWWLSKAAGINGSGQIVGRSDTATGGRASA